MYVIVVGGGNTGSYLTRLLLDGGQRVMVVEERPSVLESPRLELPPKRSWKVMEARQASWKKPKSHDGACPGGRDGF